MTKLHRTLPLSLLCTFSGCTDLSVTEGEYRAAAVQGSSCYGTEKGSCIAVAPAELLEAEGLAHALGYAAQLRQACQHGAVGQSAWVEAGLIVGEDTEQQQSAHESLAAAQCSEYATLATLLVDAMPERLAAIADEDEQLIAAAELVAHLLAASMPSGVADELALHPVLRQVDIIDDRDVSAYVRCWLLDEEDSDCRDIHLHRIASSAQHLPHTEASRLATELVGATEVVGAAMESSMRARLRQLLAPTILATCDAAKYRSPAAPCLEWLREYRFELTDPALGRAPLASEVCLYSLGANHLNCYDPTAGCGGPDGILESFSGDNGLLGLGGCAYDKMMMFGCEAGAGAPLCKLEACGGSSESPVPNLVADMLGHEQHSQLCAQLPGGGGMPDLTRYFPLDPHGCLPHRAGFDAQACAQAIGGSKQGLGQIDLSQGLEFAVDGCTTGGLESWVPEGQLSPEARLMLAKEKALDFWSDPDNRADIAAELIEETDAGFVSLDHDERAHAVEKAEFVDLSEDQSVLNDIADMYDNNPDMSEEDKQEAAKKLAPKVKAHTDSHTGAIKINSKYEGKWTVAKLTEVLKHEYVHNLATDEDGVPTANSSEEHDAVCDSGVDANACTQAGTKGGGTKYCAAESGCSDECSAAAVAAREMFEACFDEPVDLEPDDSVDPWIYPDPDDHAAPGGCGPGPQLAALDSQCLAMMCPSGTSAGACLDGGGTCCCRADGGDPNAGPGLSSCGFLLMCGPGTSPTNGEFGCTCSGPMPSITIGVPEEPDAPQMLGGTPVLDLAHAIGTQLAAAVALPQ